MRNYLLVMVYALAAICYLVGSYSIVLLLRCLIGCISLSIGLIGRTQTPVVGFLPPAHTIFLLKETLQSSLSYMNLHPASVSTLIDTSNVCAIPGTIREILDDFGSHGILISQV